MLKISLEISDPPHAISWIEEVIRTKALPVVFVLMIFNLLWPNSTVSAEIYKWVDERGTVFYSTSPPPQQEKESKKESGKKPRTMAGEQKLEFGMTINEVKTILGEPIRETQTSDIKGLLFIVNGKQRWFLYFKYGLGPGPARKSEDWDKDWRYFDHLISK